MESESNSPRKKYVKYQRKNQKSSEAGGDEAEASSAETSRGTEDSGPEADQFGSGLSTNKVILMMTILVHYVRLEGNDSLLSFCKFLLGTLLPT